MEEEKVYLVGENGDLEEIADDIIFSIPVPSDSEEEPELDKNVKMMIMHRTFLAVR